MHQASIVEDIVVVRLTPVKLATHCSLVVMVSHGRWWINKLNTGIETGLLTCSISLKVNRQILATGIIIHGVVGWVRSR